MRRQTFLILPVPASVGAVDEEKRLKLHQIFSKR
jgi:hypothetical protein